MLVKKAEIRIRFRIDDGDKGIIIWRIDETVANRVPNFDLKRLRGAYRICVGFFDVSRLWLWQDRDGVCGRV